MDFVDALLMQNKKKKEKRKHKILTFAKSLILWNLKKSIWNRMLWPITDAHQLTQFSRVANMPTDTALLHHDIDHKDAYSLVDSTSLGKNYWLEFQYFHQLNVFPQFIFYLKAWAHSIRSQGYIFLQIEWFKPKVFWVVCGPDISFLRKRT